MIEPYGPAMKACEAVAEAAGGAWAGSLNLVGVGGNTKALVVQVDREVYVVGDDDDTFDVAHYSFEGWQGLIDQVEPPVIEAADADQALRIVEFLREDAFVWQCGGCDAWIHTTNRPRVGVLPCAVCGDGGVDFPHADRHAGSDG